MLSIDYVEAASVKVLKSGNRYARQPAIPGGSKNRTAAKKTSFEKKYEKVRGLLERDKRLQNRIKQVSAQYKIDPIHIVGALVGEHTYNVDAYDTMQTYIVKAAAYARTGLDFEYGDQNVVDFVERDEFKPCFDKKNSYQLWSCRENVWDKTFKGKKVDGVKYPKNRFSAVFFQPLFAGQTFGLGQLNPLTALKLSDKVKSISGRYAIDADEPRDVYKTIMNPNSTVHYMAASIRTSIDFYKSIAKVDISKNPGITATLYNLGKPDMRAYALKRRGSKTPRENYYGWFVNSKEKELRAIISKW